MVTPMEDAKPASTLPMDAYIALIQDALCAMPELTAILAESEVRIDVTAATPGRSHEVKTWPPIALARDGVTTHVIALLVSDAAPFEYTQAIQADDDGADVIVNVPKAWQVSLPHLTSATTRAAHRHEMGSAGGRVAAAERIQDYLRSTGRSALAERHANATKEESPT